MSRGLVGRKTHPLGYWGETGEEQEQPNNSLSGLSGVAEEFLYFCLMNNIDRM